MKDKEVKDVNKKLKQYVLFTSLFLLSGCVAKGPQEKKGNTQKGETIKIGLNMELSGVAAGYGQQQKQGAEFAIQEINQKGGIKGKKVQLIIKDNKSDTAESATITSNLASKGVLAIVGPATTGNTKAAIPNLLHSQIPAITPSATDDTVTFYNGKKQDYIFRSCFQNRLQGTVLAKFASTQLHAKKVVLIGDNSNEYAVGLADAFKKTYKGQIVAEENFVTGDKDFQAILTKVKHKTFDTLYIPGYYNEASLIIKQARELGIHQAILGADGFSDPALVRIAGTKNMSNVYYSNHYSTKTNVNTRAQAFLTAFEKKYHHAPGTFQALSYDAVYMLKEAMEKTNNLNSIEIKNQLSQLKNFEGVTGYMTMDKKHNPRKDVAIIGLTKGKETSVKIISPN